MGGRVLLVIDMLKDFIDVDGALSCGEAAQKIIPFVVEKIKEFSNQNDSVIFISDCHEIDDLEFKRFPRHCVRGSQGGELIEEISTLTDMICVKYFITKNRYSGFYCTELEGILQYVSPEEVHVVGVCTNICVLYTVEELCNRDYGVVVYKDGVASFDQQAHLWALEQMEAVLGAVIS